MRRGFTLFEALIALGLGAALVGIVVYLLVQGTGITARLTPQLALQQASRKAIVRLLTELQEGMDVVVPRPGSTQPYAVVRDRLARVRWFYQTRAAGDTTELWRWIDDPTLAPNARRERLLTSIRRLTFTARGEGALQVNLVLTEEGQDYPLLTTVRLRNIAAAEEIW